jgi:hypothetical protein
LEAEAKAAREAEDAKRREAEETARKAAAAPDREKLIQFATMIRQLDVPPLATNAGKSLYTPLSIRIISLAEWIEEQSENL